MFKIIVLNKKNNIISYLLRNTLKNLQLQAATEPSSVLSNR